MQLEVRFSILEYCQLQSGKINAVGRDLFRQQSMRDFIEASLLRQRTPVGSNQSQYVTLLGQRHALGPLTLQKRFVDEIVHAG